MLSFKRFVCIILLVFILGGIFVVYNINEGQLMEVSLGNRFASEREYIEAWNADSREKTKVLLLGDAEDKRYGGIYVNVRQLCTDLRFMVTEDKSFDAGKAEEADLVIFCSASISRYADLEALKAFIGQGGRVILAAGLAEGNEDIPLWETFGIQSKSARENYHELAFEKPFLPVQPYEAVYGGDSDSVKLVVSDHALVYIQDEETEAPILYKYDHKKGSICLINGSFLSDIRCMGLLTGAMGALLPDFLYPVLGVKSVFLDNFPMSTPLDDERCMQMYGSSTESFVLNVLWPAFQGISLRTGTAYSAGVLATASSEEGFLPIQDEIFPNLGKSALQFGGELVYGADCLEDGEICYNQNFITRFSSVFTDYTIQGLTLEKDSFFPEALRIPDADIRFVRGMLDRPDMRLSWKESLTVFPEATAGNSMEDGNLFSASCVIAAYGLVSHTFDVNALFAADGKDSVWDRNRKQVALFETEILARVPWLESRTLSQTESDVKSYLSLDYGYRKNGGRLEIDCGGAAKGQAFFYHTDSRIADAEGLTYEDVGNGYYLLRIQENHGSIELEGRK